MNESWHVRYADMCVDRYRDMTYTTRLIHMWHDVACMKRLIHMWHDVMLLCVSRQGGMTLVYDMPRSCVTWLIHMYVSDSSKCISARLEVNTAYTTYIHTHTHTHKHTHTQTRKLTHTQTHASRGQHRIHCIHTCARAHTHTRTLTHTQTRAHTPWLLLTITCVVEYEHTCIYK